MTLNQAFLRVSGVVLLAALTACSSSESSDRGAGPSSYYSPEGNASGTPTSSPTGASTPTPGTPAQPAPPPVQSGATTYYSPSGAPEAKEPIISNPFVLTETDPLSTFSADVDTASYDIFRHALGEGRLPSPETVRVEEFVNYFRYDYPELDADSEEAFSIALDTAPHPFGRESTLLRVGIQGKDADFESDRRKNLVFLVDVSGSMAEANKLPLAQKVLRQALGLLAPNDTLSIVTYASGASVALAPTPISERDAIDAAITGLSASGSTAGAAGLDLAYEQAESAFVSEGINHVILCTDGDFNVGPSSTAELVTLIKSKRKTGINLTALGFGDWNLNDAMMEAVSNAGNGTYAVLTDDDQATRYVQERLLSTIHLIAKDLKIQVEFNAEEVLAYRLLGYEDRALSDEDFEDDSVDAGEVGARHRVTALYELVLRGGSIPSASGAPPIKEGDAYEGPVEVNSDELVHVQLRYREPFTGEDAPVLELSSGLSLEDLNQDADTMDADLAWAASVAQVAEVLRRSPYATPARWDEVVSLVSEQATSSPDPDKLEFRDLVMKARTLSSK